MTIDDGLQGGRVLQLDDLLTADFVADQWRSSKALHMPATPVAGAVRGKSDLW
jgi:hypothetical protein